MSGVSRPCIIAAGPNPAWQKTLFFKPFRPGEVNRAFDMNCCAAGKGVNFVRAAVCHGVADAEVLQFCGGNNGTLLEAELEREGLKYHSIRTVAATRCCTTCLDTENASMTELIEPSYGATAGETAEMLRFLKEKISGGAVSAIACCGTLPGDTDPELYLHICRLAAEFRVPVLLDAFRNIERILQSDGFVFLKINREELASLTGLDDMRHGLKQLFDIAGSLRFAAVTDGPDTAFACDGKRMASYTIPAVERVVSPLGCGDTASAVLLSEIVSGREAFDAFKIALAAASANVMSALSGSFSREDAAAIADGITVEYREL